MNSGNSAFKPFLFRIAMTVSYAGEPSFIGFPFALPQ